MVDVAHFLWWLLIYGFGLLMAFAFELRAAASLGRVPVSRLLIFAYRDVARVVKSRTSALLYLLLLTGLQCFLLREVLTQDVLYKLMAVTFMLVEAGLGVLIWRGTRGADIGGVTPDEDRSA
ncbi:MAG: hypothetical protein ABSD56_15910 [Bryobacteraceae bacterium]